MKKIKLLLSVIVVGMFYSSCEDAIDIIQEGELYPENTYETVDDLQLGLNGVYGAVGGETVISFTSIFTDEVSIGVANGGQGLNDGAYGFLLLPEAGGPTGIWTGNYAVINFANRLIAGAENVNTEPGSDEEIAKNNILAQARIWRAYSHFQLLSFFSTDLKNDNALGVIPVDFVPTIDQHLPRATNGEVFALIDSDLEYGMANLTSNLDNSARKYLSPDFITALRARMAAYRGKYTEAEALAQSLITDFSGGTMPVGLTPRSQYAQIWADLIDGEVIFKLERTVGDANISGVWNTNASDVGGAPFFEMSTDLFQLFQTGDIRRTVFIDPTSTADIVVINKYPGSEGLSLLNDLKIFRVAEMYFIKAEARVAAGDLTGAATAIRTVRNARFVTPQVVNYNSAEEAWAGILNERRIELCYEGHRYLDLKRLGSVANVDINRSPVDCAFNGACFLSSDDYRFTLPIPRVELNANPVIGSQQNPGYNQ